MSQTVTVTKTVEDDFKCFDVWSLDTDDSVDSKDLEEEMTNSSNLDYQANETTQMLRDCISIIREIKSMSEDVNLQACEANDFKPHVTKAKLDACVPILLRMIDKLRLEQNAAPMGHMFHNSAEFTFLALSKVKSYLGKLMLLPTNGQNAKKCCLELAPNDSGSIQFLFLVVSCLSSMETILCVARNHDYVLSVGSEIGQWSDDYKEKLSSAEKECRMALHDMIGYFNGKCVECVAPSEFTKLYEFRKRQHRLINALHWYKQTIKAGEEELIRLQSELEELVKNTRQAQNISVGALATTIAGMVRAYWRGGNALFVGFFASAILTLGAVANAAQTLEVLQNCNAQMTEHWAELDKHKKLYLDAVTEAKEYLDSKHDELETEQEQLVVEEQQQLREAELYQREEALRHQEAELARRLQEIEAMKAALERQERG